VFDDNEVIIPMSVLDELDNAKSRPDEVGRNAREIIRKLDSLRESGSLSDGVKLNNSIIKVELRYFDIPDGLSLDKTDNRILGTALGLQKEGKYVIVVSKDINLRVKCDAFNIKAQDYSRDKIAEDVSSIYGGVQSVQVSSQIIDELYKKGSVSWDRQAYANQFFVLKSDISNSQSAIARYKNKTLVLHRKVSEVQGIVPRNAEQKMAFELLLDPTVKLVTLIGFAGTGKTLIATAAALHHVLTENSKFFSRVLISRPVQPMGKDIGFLPGDIGDKLKPWMQPIFDNLEFILGDNYQPSLYEGLIQVEPLTYIRGRSIPKAFMIVDEAQNLTAQEVKTIITRVGEHTKIVLTGDIYQIDNPYVDFADNGLTHVVEKFKEFDIAGHITLRKGERSELATKASEIL
jgi:PhoH-like ATPase